MFANTFQSGFVSIFYSVGSAPLHLWDKQVKNGHIRRVVDDEVRSLVLEISGTNVATTYITCPIKPRVSLGIKLPFLVMIIKNMKKYFTFEIQILDDKDMHRRFRVSNFQSTTKVRPFCTTMPIGLSTGWNQVQFNLADFTKRAYGSTYLETVRVQIHANVRIRRIYFSDVLYSDDELPNEYKLFVPTPGTQLSKGAKGKKSLKEEARPSAVEEKKPSVEQLELPKEGEEEIPSGALPSPLSAAQGEEAPPQEAAIQDDTTADMTESSQVPTEVELSTVPDTEPPSDVTDAAPESVPVSEVTEATTDETAGEAAAAEPQEATAEGEVQPETSGDAPADSTAEAPAEEAEAAGEAPAEAPTETAAEAPTEAPVEAAPETVTEEPPAESPPAEEPPAEAPAEPEAPAAEEEKPPE